MIKYIEFDSIDDTGRHIIPVNSGRQMIKLASNTYSPEISNVLATMQRRPDRYYVVINALGSYEVWGPNRNGDAFPESGLSHLSLRTDMGTPNDYGYKTFEYYAKFFYHHCFDGDMLIKTINGFIPIKDINIGDDVYTHTGTAKKVLNKFNRIYDGEFRSIKVAGIDNNIICTPNHKFQVIKKDKLICYYHRNCYKKNRHGNFCYKFKSGEAGKMCVACNHYKDADPEWMEVKDIQPGDYLIKTPEIINDNTINIDLGIVYGFFLSEGCFIVKNNRFIGIQFTFNKNEVEFIDKLITSLKNIGLRPTRPYIHKKNKTALITVSSVPFANKLLKLFGRYSHNLTINKDVVREIGYDGVCHMLGAYLDGDGSVYKSGQNKDLIRIRSSSLKLLIVVQDLFHSIGVLATYNVDQKEKRQFGKYFIKPNGYVSISQSQAHKLKHYSIKCRQINNDRKRTTQSSFIYNNQFLFRVDENNIFNDKRAVYNLEVECDNSYQVFGFNTHNCNKDPNKCFGDVIYSYWNPLTHRIELIVGLDTVKAADVIKSLENDEVVSVSMGTKVKFDRCNICDNKSATVKQYCLHLKKYMGQIVGRDLAVLWSHELGKTILPGTQVFAWNDFPRFFDISKVYIGADRTAFVIAKAASRSVVTWSASIAEAMGVTDDMIDKIAVIGKQSEIDKEVGSVTKDDIDGKVFKAPEIVAVKKDIDDKVSQTIAAEPALPSQLLDSISSTLPLRNVLSTLFGLGIHPKPAEFQRIILVSIGEKPIADALDSEHTVFDYNDNSSPQDLDISNSNFSDSLGRLLTPYLTERSAFPSFLGPRIQTILIKKAAIDPAPQQSVQLSQSSISPALALGGIAALYAGLKLKAAGYGPKELANIFVNKPWLRDIIGGGALYTIFSLINKSSESDSLLRPARDYEGILQDTNFSGHMKTAGFGIKGTTAATALGFGGLTGAVVLPSAYIINSYNQKSLYNRGKELFPGAGTNPVHASIAGGATVAAGTLLGSENVRNRIINKLRKVK